VRIEALQTLTERTKASQVYHTLRELVLDRQQPALLRQAAIMKLGKFTREDNGAVLLDVAREDANREIQGTAIEVYAQSVPDKRQAVEGLVTLFRRFDAAGASRDAPLGTTLYAIASVGDDHATDFLVQLARSHPREEIRSSAVFYLGAIGSDRARTALIRLLKGE
jgi:HEAT repeat protein